MKDQTRPICLNYGCNNLVTSSGTRWRPFCSRCHKAGYDKTTTLAEGVTPFKTGMCSNQDGRLGFCCPIDYTKASWAVGMTELDHVDCNHLHNVPENVMELCKICHHHKGKLSGDFKNQNRYTYNKKC